TYKLPEGHGACLAIPMPSCRSPDKRPPHLETLEALLDGLDVLITGKVHPRTSKLRVLDLMNVHFDFWSFRAETHGGDCSLPMNEKQPMIVTDLEITKANFNEHDRCLLQKLKIWDLSIRTAIETFKIVDVDCILAAAKSVYLKTPLETLSITDCWLSQTWSLNICELRHLNLSDVVLSALCPKPLGVLSERITSTLQTLELEKCGMRESHFILTKVNFYQNDISLLILKNLLHHTAKLSKLTHETYLASLECYDSLTILRDRFKQLCLVLRVKRLLKK
ncbi:hypothetical protein U0070_004348, partial [Myodes glareolus]